MNKLSEDEAIEIMLDNKKEYERIIKELDDVKDTNDNKPIETIQDCQKFVQAIETILNELKTYKQLYISTLGHSLNNSIKQNNKHNNDLEALNEGWKIEIEKKDKIIDAMAKEWFELDSLFMIRGKNIHSEKELKQYFERRAEDE